MRCAGDMTGGFKSAEGGRERLVTYAQSCTQGAMRGGAGAAQVSDDAFSEGHGARWRRRRRVIGVVELGSGRKGLAVAGEFGVVLQLETNQRGLASAGVIGGQQMERQRRWRGCSTMLDGEPQAVGPAGEIEVGITPGPEVTAAAQRLAGNGGTALAGMVDEEDGGVEGDSQFTQCGENGGDLAGVIFIGALEAYERIKDQQLGALAGERKVESVQVLGTVETERGVEDESDIECGEVGAARVRDTLDATFDLMRRVFSREDEHRPGTGDREAAQARTTGGDRDRQLQRQKCLAALGGSADHTDRRSAPQRLDEPVRLVCGEVLKLSGADHAQCCHG